MPDFSDKKSKPVIELGCNGAEGEQFQILKNFQAKIKVKQLSTLNIIQLSCNGRDQRGVNVIEVQVPPAKATTNQKQERTHV